MDQDSKMEFDVFISHASEDKDSFVKELASTLTLAGVKVWYDDDKLLVGDSISKSIDYGLSNSQFGIVLISPHFIAKGWTDYELRSLIEREVGYRKVILPVWHNVTKEQVQKFSLYLSQKFALNTSRLSLEDVVTKLVELIRPDIYQNFQRHLLYEKTMKEGQAIEAKPTDIFHSTIRHESLPNQWLNRIEIIHAVTGKFLKNTLEETIQNFKKDTNPDRELMIWEAIVSSLFEITEKHRIKDQDAQKEIFTILLGYSFGRMPKETRFAKDEALVEIYKVYERHFPIKDEDGILKVVH